ncbi:riboflavin synthase alpha chain [Xenococcus sp. PCC 7305]|uniref:riboflavin synthase n=1 Tax=Xenococcus sp. PCC 7305 TaxID=102125 RepID=UPI0002AD0757|nr:riboflavin synthase [Xenococcus sp. PCC 7305]ELS03391.1 riboflavin synthase alpha chain [Xenococcus sp. PCC 7305]
MFTGLIEALGTTKIQEQNSFEITVVKGDRVSILSDLEIGDSVAVDGVCLTVETLLPQGFIATASPETIMRTTLSKSDRPGNYVNLETSLRAGGKIGGHFVTGHVDGMGCLVESIATEQSWEITFGIANTKEAQWQDNIAPYLASKGSITVNGISLTIAETAADGSWFKAAVIPLTYAETNLSYLESGDLVNIESDILGKYVARLIGDRKVQKTRAEDISLAFLTDHGYT